MKRTITKWKIHELESIYKPMIGFPEFQRETVWDLIKKQMLIDSIFRGFDISPLYFYASRNEDGEIASYDCIDGRQRINTIYSYLAKNTEEDPHNGFKAIVTNEIYDDPSNPLYQAVDNKNYEQLDESYKCIFNDYELNVILLEETVDEKELNLLFLRLQNAVTLNSGEKLHAMKGDMRDFVFLGEPKGIREHNFFSENGINIPYKRYAREQVAAQIALNYFKLQNKHEFGRSRYIDLQLFFKEKSKFDDNDKELVSKLKTVLQKIDEYFRESISLIKNRALAISIFFMVNELIESDNELQIPKFKEFIFKFLATLVWQVKEHQRLSAAEAYKNILSGFQNYITQAAGESYAIKKRHEFLKDYFEYYLRNGNKIKGDDEYAIERSESPDIHRNDYLTRQQRLPDS
ncbi:MAG: DUF262 domain-containing protein [Dehalogenimonas sp.]